MLLTRSCPCATKMQKQNPFCGKHSIQSRRSLRARGAFDPSDFRRLFNPIPTWEGRLGPPHYYLTHQIFRPSYGLVILSSLCAARATPWKMVVKDFHLLFSVKILDLLLSVCITHWNIFCWKYYWSYFISTSTVDFRAVESQIKNFIFFTEIHSIWCDYIQNIH